MNPDYYSDIKLSERFIFQSSIYLLSMFEKKIDSYVSNRTKTKRQNLKKQLFHRENILDPVTFMEDPVKALGKDLTKPVWNCITKMQVTVICAQEQKGNDIIKAYNSTLLKFFHRYKNEHEDESSFKINVNIISKEEAIQKKIRQIQYSEYNGTQWAIMKELFAVLNKTTNKYVQELESQNISEEDDSYKPMISYIQASGEILQKLVEKDKQGLSYMYINLLAEIFNFTTLIQEQIKLVIQSLHGPTVINYFPELQFLPQIIHPILMGIYMTIKQQIKQKQDQSKNKTQFSQNTQFNIQEQDDTVFDQIKNGNYSKITFINLDGHQSPYNLFICKYLSRYLQYFSFPLEEQVLLDDTDLSTFFEFYSQNLSKGYSFSELTAKQKQFFHKIFKTKQKTDKQLLQYYKRMFIFPINSLYLNKKYNISSIQYFHSSYIKFLMREIIYNQIKDFNPSVIIISYSNKLSIENQHFQEIIKELTIISNMKLIFYNNLTRSYMYKQNLPAQMPSTETFYNIQKKYNEKYERNISLFTKNDINYNIFDKISMFLKIASGSYTLNKVVEQDSGVEKYSVYKVQKYAGNILKILGRHHPVLEKYRNRSFEYLRVEKMLSNIYQICESTNRLKNFEFPLSNYHKELIQAAEREIQNQGKNYSQIKENILSQYGQNANLSQSWRSFIHNLIFQIQKQKEQEETKFITRLPKYKQQIDNDDDQNHFIALEFEVQYGGYVFPVGISKQSQICVDNNRKSRLAHIYLINHLIHNDDSQLRNFYGIIDQSIDNLFQTKVHLRQLTFNQTTFQLTPFQHFARFNYTQTQKYTILFWPIVYDKVEALLSKFSRMKYEPNITNLIFIAEKTNPGIFKAVTPSNQTYNNILPRIGCTCYQVPSTQIIYIFGGFYTKKQNYLSFQVDITVMSFLKNDEFLVENIPKKFHFDYHCSDNQSKTFLMTNIRQDFVRPKIEYEVYQFDNTQSQKINIFLLGGVGEKFMRPFSMIGYMAHHISFLRNGQLNSIRRVKLNNLVPVNLKKPVLCRTNFEVKTVESAQNRRFYCKTMNMPPNSPIYTWFKNKYIKEQQKMLYEKQIQFALLESDDRQQKGEALIALKEKDITYRACLKHLSSLAQIQNKITLVYQNMITIPTQVYQPIILNIQLQLSEESYSQFKNLQSNCVPLVGSNIFALDTYGLEIYAILKHQQYTNNHFILAYCNLSINAHKIIEDNQRKIFLKQIYRFDGKINYHIIKALPQKKLAIVHSVPLNKQVIYEEFILKKTTKGSMIKKKVNNEYNTYSINNQPVNSAVYKGNSISFYHYYREGIVSWTFKTNKRGKEEEHYFIMEELNCNEEFAKWKLKHEKIVKFKLGHNNNEEFASVILDIKISGQKKQRFQMFILVEDTVYVANMDAHLSETTSALLFKSIQKSFQEYNTQKYKPKFIADYLIKLDKNKRRYQENIQQMEIQNS